ncbi:cell division protein ZapA [Lactobacillus sp. S2-2]|uniref:cell division protein ZapA n=1 Tax=Lactobacillus sp. S2-2 TaxID=2692917 RepID=UPI001F209A06|nr:cell division protein ZapA [Lactobacillus sp. S2-2]MCF6515815.1 cell division protein ZapA [Lactobacillus sp. S2-2]
MNNKKRFKADIQGKTYTFIGDSSDEHMRAVSELLNQQIEQLKVSSPNSSNEDLAILIAFNSMSNQIKKQIEIDELKKGNED